MQDRTRKRRGTPCVFRRPAQRLRRRLTEQVSIGDREAPELPKPEVRGQPGDGRRGCVRLQQCATDKVHSAQEEIADRTHSQMLFARGAERSLRHGNSRTDFRQIVRRVGVLLQKSLEPCDDRIVATATDRGIMLPLSFSVRLGGNVRVQRFSNGSELRRSCSESGQRSTDVNSTGFNLRRSGSYFHFT